MNLTQEENDIVEIADEIFNYLSTNTDSVDSLEGIAEWLKQHGHPVGLEDIKRALEYLKAAGLVIESPGRHGKTLYKSAYASTGEI
jgi:Fe2+ or Zn2+ uptake regulation protein